MDAEPGRCRRTDGQKWRCRLAVLPDQKYCERHVHRGRNRSRKPVEVDQTLLKTSISTMKANAPNLESATKTNARKHNKVGIKNQSHKIKKYSTENACTPLEFSFFPESAIQGDNVLVCKISSNDNSSAVVVAESIRCRRTDGKKWRCSKEVVPDQKYCLDHMYRGVKKVEDNSQKSNTSLSFSVGASYQQSGDNVNPSNDDNGSDANHANRATTNCGSDATTISS